MWVVCLPRDSQAARAAPLQQSPKAKQTWDDVTQQAPQWGPGAHIASGQKPEAGLFLRLNSYAQPRVGGFPPKDMDMKTQSAILVQETMKKMKTTLFAHPSL